MKTMYVVSRGWWNYQNGAADFGYYSFAPLRICATYSEALHYVGKFGYKNYWCSEGGWWTGDGLLKITELMVD